MTIETDWKPIFILVISRPSICFVVFELICFACFWEFGKQPAWLINWFNAMSLLLRLCAFEWLMNKHQYHFDKNLIFCLRAVTRRRQKTTGTAGRPTEGTRILVKLRWNLLRCPIWSEIVEFHDHQGVTSPRIPNVSKRFSTAGTDGGDRSRWCCQ